MECTLAYSFLRGLGMREVNGYPYGICFIIRTYPLCGITV